MGNTSYPADGLKLVVQPGNLRVVVNNVFGGLVGRAFIEFYLSHGDNPYQAVPQILRALGSYITTITAGPLGEAGELLSLAKISLVRIEFLFTNQDRWRIETVFSDLDDVVNILKENGLITT